MKRKKIMLGGCFMALVTIAVGCGNGNDKKTASSESSSSVASSTSSSAAVESSKDSEANKSITYTAVVKTDSNSENGQILVEKLTPTDAKEETPAMFNDQVVLLTDGSNVLNKETKEAVSLDEIKAGTTLEVTLAARPISTMSIPPQIAGRDVHEVLVVK